MVDRIKMISRRAFGQKVMEWASGQTPTPGDLIQAQEQLNGIVEFPLPGYIEHMSFVHTRKEVWTIRLPPDELLKDTLSQIGTPGHQYPLDPIYEKRINGQYPDDHAFFEFRVGDYTCALCA